MNVPYVAGDRDQPDWWGPQDDAILAGELAKLEGLPRVAVPPEPFVPGAPTTLPARTWWRTPVGIGTLIVLGATSLWLILLFTFLAPRPTAPPSAPSDIVVTTYGPPGANGGPLWFTTMPQIR